MDFLRGWEGEIGQKHIFCGRQPPPTCQVLELAVWHVIGWGGLRLKKTRKSFSAKVPQEGRKKGWLLLRPVD